MQALYQAQLALDEKEKQMQALALELYPESTSSSGMQDKV